MGIKCQQAVNAGGQWCGNMTLVNDPQVRTVGLTAGCGRCAGRRVAGVYEPRSPSPFQADV